MVPYPLYLSPAFLLGDKKQKDRHQLIPVPILSSLELLYCP